jgi:hypothetical protein
MRTADGGGYGGEGNWAGQDVRALWPLLAGQETSAHWRQVEGWRKACDLISTHLSRLRGYRENLAAVWPPERSAAARAYLDRLDFLIDTVAQTHEAAVANHDTFRAAILAIDDSRQRLRQIHDEYVAKEEIKRGHEARLAANPAAQLTDVPPVTDTELEHLNIRARGVMSGLSDELSLAQVRLTRPPTYQSSPSNSQDQTSVAVQSGATVPVIPPVIPISAGTPPTVRSHPRSNNPTQRITAAMPPRDGPLLGAANPAASPGSSRSQSAGVATIGLISGGNPGMVSVSPHPRTTSAGSSMSRGVQPGPPRAFPAGTTGTTGTTGTPNGAPSTNGTPSSGLVGSAPSSVRGTDPSATAARGMTNMPGVIGGANSNTAAAQTAHSRFGVQKMADRYSNPWDHQEGVTPVVSPPPDQRPIDTGPVISGRAG